MGQVGHIRHILGQGVVAVAGVDEIVAQPAARVGETVAQRHPLCHRFIGQPQFGQIAANGRVQTQFARFHQAHGNRRGDGFGGGADLKEGVAVHGQGVGDICDAEASRVCLVVVKDAYGHAGHVPALHFVGDERFEREVRIGHCHSS